MKHLFSRTALRATRNLPGIFELVRNPFRFLTRYALLVDSPMKIRLALGQTISIKRAHEAALIPSIYLNHEYGRIPPGSVVVDIGANIGVFTVYAARTARKVISYEPVSVNYDLLCRNVEDNGLRAKVVSHKMAVGGKKGVQAMHKSERSTTHVLSDRADTETVEKTKVTTLGTEFKKHGITVCDVLKIDCEGSEYQILYSLPRDIFQKIKSIRMEYHLSFGNPKKGEPKHLINHIKKQGFVLTRHISRPLDGILWFDRE